MADIGIVIVTYCSGDVILDCLESLLAETEAGLEIVIVDNASPDDTLDILRSWADGTAPYEPPSPCPVALKPAPKPVTLASPDAPRNTAGRHRITLIENAANTGYAGGVNVGLAHLAKDTTLDRFWVLNPDSITAPGTPATFARHPVPETGFAMIGGRIVYLENPDQIQIDGGRVDWRTGVTHSINQYQKIDTATPPAASEIDFISGASLVASRAFYETVGPMREDYFLYYEEVDWALRRGDLPLLHCPEALIYHQSGSAIGSSAPNRPASPFSLYFLHRSRLKFMRRFRPGGVPFALLFSIAKAGQLALKGYLKEAGTVLKASFGGGPPKSVRARLSDAAARIAFGKA